jgi:hypothetical protein
MNDAPSLATISSAAYASVAVQVPRGFGETPSTPRNASGIQSPCGGAWPVSLRAWNVEPLCATTSPR